ncbi:MAG: Fic family protein [Planctomycetota bacterium]
MGGVTLSDCARNALLYINTEALVFRVSSGLIAESWQSDEDMPETLHPVAISDVAHDGTKPGPRRDHDESREALESTPHVPHVDPTSTPQVGTKLALSRHQVEILRKCNEDSLLVDLMVITGRSDRTKFRDQVLNPLISAGFIEMTVPDKPRSSKQRYRTTAAGRAVLESPAKETHS